MEPRTEQQAHAVEMSQDWQIGKTTVVERAKHLLNSGLYADCEFLVGANGSEQEVSHFYSWKKYSCCITFNAGHQGQQNLSGHEQPGI